MPALSVRKPDAEVQLHETNSTKRALMSDERKQNARENAGKRAQTSAGMSKTRNKNAKTSNLSTPHTRTRQSPSGSGLT